MTLYQGYTPPTDFERNKAELRSRLSLEEYQRFMNGAVGNNTHSLAELVVFALEFMDWREQHQDERPS